MEHGLVKRNVPSVLFCGFKRNGISVSDVLTFVNNSCEQYMLNIKIHTKTQ